MKLFYKFNLLCLLFVAYTHQIVPNADNRPSKRQRLTDTHTDASFSMPRYQTRSVTERMAQQQAAAKEQEQQVVHYKDRIKKFNYLDLPEDLQREVGEFYGVDAISRTLHHSPLQLAINKNDGDQIQILLALHANINGTPHGCKKPPLYKSIEEYNFNHYSSSHRTGNTLKKSYAIFKYLLQKEADCNKPNSKENIIPLILAVHDIQTIPLFLDLIDVPNINLHATNYDGRTALDFIKEHAMVKHHQIKMRKGCYRICAFLEKKGIASSVILEPMPTDEIMHQQYFDAWDDSSESDDDQSV